MSDANREISAGTYVDMCKINGMEIYSLADEETMECEQIRTILLLAVKV